MSGGYQHSSVPQMLLLHSWDHLNLVPKPPNSQHMLL
jgi:hypothetical protein